MTASRCDDSCSKLAKTAADMRLEHEEEELVKIALRRSLIENDQRASSYADQHFEALRRQESERKGAGSSKVQTMGTAQEGISSLGLIKNGPSVGGSRVFKDALPPASSRGPITMQPFHSSTAPAAHNLQEPIAVQSSSDVDSTSLRSASRDSHSLSATEEVLANGEKIDSQEDILNIPLQNLRYGTYSTPHGYTRRDYDSYDESGHPYAIWPRVGKDSHGRRKIFKLKSIMVPFYYRDPPRWFLQNANNGVSLHRDMLGRNVSNPSHYSSEPNVPIDDNVHFVESSVASSEFGTNIASACDSEMFVPRHSEPISRKSRRKSGSKHERKRNKDKAKRE